MTRSLVLCTVLVENLDHYVAQFGYRFPLNLSANGSCQIRTKLANNAGGSTLVADGP